MNENVIERKRRLKMKTEFSYTRRCRMILNREH